MIKVKKKEKILLLFLEALFVLGLVKPKRFIVCASVQTILSISSTLALTQASLCYYSTISVLGQCT